MLDGEPDITIEEKQWEIEKIKRLNMNMRTKTQIKKDIIEIIGRL